MMKLLDMPFLSIHYLRVLQLLATAPNYQQLDQKHNWGALVWTFVRDPYYLVQNELVCFVSL